MRPAPRRGSAGRPRSRIHWDKLGRVVLVLVLFAILISYVGPGLKLISSWRGAGEQRAELRTLQQQNARLKERAAELQQPAAAEHAARKLGMVAVGERPYVIRGLDR